MALDDDFKDAQDRVTKLASRPGNDDLLELYALYKQATVGDVTGKQPSRLKFEARAKWDAWNGKKGTGADAAKEKYVALVKRLEG